MKKIILRADGNNTIGLGHVYRLLALAEILNKDYDCVFVINHPAPFLQSQILKVCSTLVNLDIQYLYKTPDAITPSDEFPADLRNILSGNEIVVTDGYFFGDAYQQEIKATGCSLVCIDDNAINFFRADVIINHAPGIDSQMYRSNVNTQILSGLDYIILRQPFFKPLSDHSKLPERAFISLGGSDAQRYTLKLVNYLLASKVFNKIDILASSTFDTDWLNEIQSTTKKVDGLTLHKGLDAFQLVELMDKCTHAFVAASTVLMEAYSRGLKCFTGHYANNHLFIYNGFVKENLAVGMGHFSKMTFSSFKNLLKEGETLSKLKQSFQSTEKIKMIFASLC